MENTRGQTHPGLKTLALVLVTRIWQGFRIWQPEEVQSPLHRPTSWCLVPASEERGWRREIWSTSWRLFSLLQLLASILAPCHGSEVVSQVPARCRVGGRQQYPTLGIDLTHRVVWVGRVLKYHLVSIPAGWWFVPPCDGSSNATLGGKSISSPSSDTIKTFAWGKKKKAFSTVSWVGVGAKSSLSRRTFPFSGLFGLFRCSHILGHCPPTCKHHLCFQQW